MRFSEATSTEWTAYSRSRYNSTNNIHRKQYEEEYLCGGDGDNNQTEVPTPSPTVVPNCEKDNGKKFEYSGDKYSCKQLNRTKRKYRKRMCKRVKQAKTLCPVICKYKT